MKLRAVVALLAIAVLGMGAGALAPAYAATQYGSRTDARGDAPATIDLTKVSITQTSTSVVITLHVRHLSRTAHAQFDVGGSWYSDYGGTYDEIAETWVGRDGRVRVRIYEGEDAIITSCRGLSARWRPSANTITISSPRRCGYADWSGTKFQASSLYGNGCGPWCAGVKPGHDSVRPIRVS